MGKKKLIIFMLMILMCVTSAFSVQVVRQDSNTPVQEDSKLKTIVVTIFTIGTVAMIFIFFIIIFAWILMKIYKKLTDFKRRKRDFMYDIFENDANQCHINRDTTMKYRNWKLLWFFWKRDPVWIDKGDGGMSIIGGYNGECIKKESFMLLCIYNKLGFFRYIEQVIFIPLDIKKQLIKEIYVGKKKVLILNCDGVDQVDNTDYYMIPLIKDRKGKYLDFADMIHKDYIEKTVHREIIKDNMLEYKQGITKAVEMNAQVQVKRRSE